MHWRKQATQEVSCSIRKSRKRKYCLEGTMDFENAESYAPNKSIQQQQHQQQQQQQQQQSITASSAAEFSSTQTLLPPNVQIKRKKRPNFSGLRTIQVHRGPKGFGFTLCGNAPCCLDCVVKGSQAEAAGLSAGQYIMTINGENVSTSSIEQVIQLIMSCRGTLTLNVARDEDDDSVVSQANVRVKPRSRPRSSLMSNLPQTQTTESHAGQNPAQSTKQLDQSPIERATAEILQTDAFNSFFNSGSMESSAGTSERSQKNSLSSLPSSLNGHANSGTSGAGTMSSFESLEAPGKSTTSVSTARTQNNLQSETRKTSQTSLQANWERDVPVNGESKSSLKNLNNSDDICSAAETGRFYAVVGYIGTIDIPPQLQGHQPSMLAFLQSSIGKMQSEQKTTFMLLLEIGEKHVRLINAKNVTVTCIELDAVLCCFGTAGETKHCFAILAQTSPSPLHSPAGSSNQSTGTPLISCMLLSVDPQIAQHSVHLKAAKKFTIACSRITSSLCKEFPLNCGEIVNRIQAKVSSNPAKNYLSELNPNKAETFCRTTSGNRNSAVVACTDKACEICAGHTMTLNSNAFSVMKQNPRSVLNHSVKQQIIRAQTPVEVVATVAPNQPRQSAQPFSSLETPTHRQSEHRTSTLPPSTGMTSKSQHVHDFVYGATTSSHRCPSEVEEVDRGQSLQSGGGGYWPRIGSWAASFDNLLQDPIGVEIFSQFLKKEFAEENIIFYQYCQQFKRLTDTFQMNELAMRIFNQHLTTGCPHPVNVDNQVLMSVCEKLSSNMITKDLFDDAQLQIYKLMKFDPYSRFLKSEAYINCVKTGNPFAQGKAAVAAVVEPKKLITAGNQSMASSDATSEDSNQPDNKKHNNLFQSKKSILPWKRKPKLSSNDMSSDSSMKSLEKSKGISQSSDSLLLSVPSSTTLECQTQCRVYLPNGCHVTMDCARRESVGSAVAALCNDYNLKMKCLEIVDGEHKAINTGETIANYGGREIYLERRVYFRVELPSSQNIGVKSKPNISIKDVFQPLLVKYCLSLNNLVLRLHDSSSPLNLQLAVAVLDSKKVVAETIEQYTLHTSEKENRYQQAPTQLQQMGHQRRTEPRQSQMRRQSDQPANIMSHHQLYQNQGQVQGNQITGHNSRQHSQGPKVCRNLGSNSQGRPQAAVAPSQRTIRPSNEEHNVYSSHETDGHHHNHETTSMSNQTDLNPEHGHLFGLLAKVQGSRMDNQRGIMSVSKLEMPSFLEPKQSAVPILHSTPEKYGSCCPSASCLHLLHETPLQSTMIYPPQKEQQGGGGGVNRKPPSGKHRRGSNFSDQRRPLVDSQMVDGMSRQNPRSLSKMITPIPGHMDNYYYISDDSAFDINPSQLPSPSSQMYPMSSAVPTNSEVISRSPLDTFTSSVYEEDIYQDNRMRRPNTTKVSSMTRSNSTDWLEKSSGSYECRRGAADYPDHFAAGGQSSLYPSGPEASTFSSSTSNHRQASNLHYPSTASNQSWQSNPVEVAPYNIDDRQGMNSQRTDHLMNDQQHSLVAQPPKIYHVWASVEQKVAAALQMTRKSKSAFANIWTNKT